MPLHSLPYFVLLPCFSLFSPSPKGSLSLSLGVSFFLSPIVSADRLSPASSSSSSSSLILGPRFSWPYYLSSAIKRRGAHKCTAAVLWIGDSCCAFGKRKWITSCKSVIDLKSKWGHFRRDQPMILRIQAHPAHQKFFRR